MGDDRKRILDVVGSPADLKVLTDEELALLADEIRSEIIEVTSKTGGHVSASLGTVELILAAHSVLDCPRDKLVFDVGHQAYAHKLVTGRLRRFGTLRTYGGLSGFPKPSESPYDAHPSGHASDSLSVALGLAKARDLAGGQENVVALIGDAALAGGMAFEALNQIGAAQTRMVIILNDNEMAISHNVGALMKHLERMRVSAPYRQMKESIHESEDSSGEAGRAFFNFGRTMRDSMKQLVLPHAMMYEQMGILCTAPIDGHDIPQLKETLRMLLEHDGPSLMHVVTTKGKGYAPAVADPVLFHGIGPYDVKTGEPRPKPAGPPTYTQAFGQALLSEARADGRIVALTAAMMGGTGLADFAREFPERFVDTGITEEHAVGMASGLALGGAKPVVALYSTFLQRAVDQLIVNNALAGTDVVFAIDRAGIVGCDGPTHHGVFDVVYTRMVPGMRVLAPSDEAELANALHTALALGGPFAIRYPRGQAEGVPMPDEPEVLEPGRSRVAFEPPAAAGAGAGAVDEASDDASDAAGTPDAVVLAFGRMVGRSVEAARLLGDQGIRVRVVDMRWVKPLDEQAVREAAHARAVITVEEGVVCGGVGEEALRVLAGMGYAGRAVALGVPDEFVCQGTVDQLLSILGLDAEGIAHAIASALGTNPQWICTTL